MYQPLGGDQKDKRGDGGRERAEPKRRLDASAFG